jgi:hypothetical protein
MEQPYSIAIKVCKDNVVKFMQFMGVFLLWCRCCEFITRRSMCKSVRNYNVISWL